MTDRTTERAQGEPPTAEPRCGCNYRCLAHDTAPDVRDVHDDLLRWLNGSDGLVGIVALLDQLEIVECSTMAGANLPWRDLADFVMDHNFDDPHATAQLARHLMRLFERDRQLATITEAGR